MSIATCCLLSFLRMQVSLPLERTQYRQERTDAMRACQQVWSRYSVEYVFRASLPFLLAMIAHLVSVFSVPLRDGKHSQLKGMAPEFEAAPATDRRKLKFCYLAKAPRADIYEFAKSHIRDLRPANYPPKSATPGYEPV